MLFRNAGDVSDICWDWYHEDLQLGSTLGTHRLIRRRCVGSWDTRQNMTSPAPRCVMCGRVDAHCAESVGDGRWDKLSELKSLHQRRHEMGLTPLRPQMFIIIIFNRVFNAVSVTRLSCRTFRFYYNRFFLSFLFQSSWQSSDSCATLIVKCCSGLFLKSPVCKTARPPVSHPVMSLFPTPVPSLVSLQDERGLIDHLFHSWPEQMDLQNPPEKG